MEFTIKKIISIDRNAEKFREKMDKEIYVKKKELENAIFAMNEKAKMEIEKKQISLIEQQVNKANKEAEKILTEGKKKVEITLKKFYQEENKISEKVFNAIIASLEED